MKNQPIISRFRFHFKTVNLFSVPGYSPRLFLSLIFPVMLLLLAQATTAETPAENRRTIILPGSEEITVTASRTEEEVAFVPSSVTVLTDQDIQNSSARNIPELLSSTPGITVTDLTGGKRNYRVDVRGFGETSGANTLVLVNGRRVNQPDLSGVDWTQLSLSQVKRIEIVRGGRGGVLFGDNASAGVINIITDSSESNRGRISLLGGSYESLGLEAGYSGKSNLFSYSLSGDLYDSDGYRDNSHTRGQNAGGSLNYSPNDWFRLSLSSGYHHDETGMPGALTETNLESGTPRSGTVYPDDRFRVTDYYFQARPRFLFLQNSLFETEISFRKRDNAFYSSAFWGQYQGNTELETLAVSPKLVIVEQLEKMNNRLSVGLDLTLSDEEILNTTSYSPQAAFSLKKNNLGAYVHDELFLAENLAISGGYRYDRVEYGFGPALGEKPDFSEGLATAGICWQFRDNSNLYLEYGSGLRYPLLDEIFDFFSNSINSNLRPQASDSYQAGARIFLSNTFYVNSSFYNIRTEDEIFFNPQGGPWGFGANENFGGTNSRKGLEIGSGMQLNQLTLTGSFTLANSEVEDGMYSGSAVPGVPAHSFSVKGIYFISDSFDITLEGIYTGERYFESDWGNSFPKQDDYFLLNSRIKYRTGGMLLHLDLKNILNQEDSQYGVLGGFPTQRAYYPSPKFNVMAGITFGF
ncbi:MAG: TonB-dependent receptor [Acidobacteriota bacterium]